MKAEIFVDIGADVELLIDGLRHEFKAGAGVLLPRFVAQRLLDKFPTIVTLAPERPKREVTPKKPKRK